MAEYAQTHLRPEVAVQAGFVDELITPMETRSRLAWSLRTLQGAV